MKTARFVNRFRRFRKRIGKESEKKTQLVSSYVPCHRFKSVFDAVQPICAASYSTKRNDPDGFIPFFLMNAIAAV